MKARSERQYADRWLYKAPSRTSTDESAQTVGTYDDRTLHFTINIEI